MRIWLVTLILVFIVSTQGMCAEIDLTPDEEAWLRNHKTIRIAGPAAFPPFQYSDENGTPQGIAVDYVRFISRQLGIDMQIQKKMTWAAVLENIRDHRTDVLSCVSRTSERESYMRFTQPYLSFPMVIITRKDAPFIGGLKDLFGRKIAFIEKASTFEWLRQDKIEFIPHWVKSPLDALKAVSIGTADAHIENLAAAVWLIEKNGLANLKIAAPTDYGSYELYFAVRSDYPELADILNKALSAMTPEKHRNIRQKWLSVNYEEKIDWQFIVPWIIASLFILLITLLWNRRLAKEINQRHQIAETLKESEEHFRGFYELALCGMAITSLEKSWVRVNDYLCKMLGYPREELVTKTWKELTHPDDLSPDESQFNRILAGETDGYLLDKRFVRKNGEIIYTSMSVKCSRREDGSTDHFVTMIQDITHRKLMEQELLDSKEDAEAASRAKSIFLANMSHEIRTPMNSVLGFLSLALEDSNIPEKQRKYLSTAYASSKSLLNLINDILDVSKLESRKLELENIPFNLYAMMRESIRSLDIVAKDKGLSLKLETDANVPENVIGDPTRLRQILINLVGNAIKFTEKGSVTVSVRRVGEAERNSPERSASMVGYASASPTLRTLHFTVEDTGIGIPADRLDKIFDPFTQADGSTARRFGGTGLGTTISKQLAELMGGGIWAESEEGKGSIFHFTICMELTDTIPKAEPECLFSGSYRCFRILIAEDIEENITLAKIRLEQQGHTVIEARNGREATEAFRKEKPDIILMDVHMPEMDGLEATREIRNYELGIGNQATLEIPDSQFLIHNSSHIPIIALTASVMKEDQKICQEAGMDAVVGKPIDFEELFEVMEKIVPKEIGSPSVRRVGEAERNPPYKNLEALIYKKRQNLQGFLRGIDIEKGLGIWQNEAVYKKALLGFSRDYKDAAEKMSTLVRNGNREGAYQIAHGLKGVAGNLSVTEVFHIASKLNDTIMEADIGELVPMIESLSTALDEAVASIGQQLAPELPKNLGGLQDLRGLPSTSTNLGGLEDLRGLFKDLLNSFEEYDPAAVEPFLEKLSHQSLSLNHLEPIKREVEKFDFDKAKEETVKLIQTLEMENKSRG